MPAPPPYLPPDALRDDAESAQRRAQAPRSPIAGHLGARYPAAEVAAVEQLADLEPATLHAIVAFPVPSLTGVTFDVVDFDTAGDLLQQVLHDHLPGFDWQVPPDWRGPLAKYLILHTSLAAPPNDAVPEPMALEVHAEAVAVDGVPLHSAEGEAWYQGFLMRDSRHGTLHALGTVRFRIRVATYANVSYPGIGVPFYL